MGNLFGKSNGLEPGQVEEQINPLYAIYVSSDPETSSEGSQTNSETGSTDFDNDFYWNMIARNINKEKDIKTKMRDIRSLHKGVLYIPSAVLETRDSGGMCLLHRVLRALLNLRFSYGDDQQSEKVHDQLLDIVKLLLIKSDTDYRGYDYTDEKNFVKKSIILSYLTQIDEKYKKEKKCSVTDFMRQILHGEEDKFINKFETSKVADKFIHKFETSNVACERYLKSFRNFRDLLEVAFTVGSVKTLKFLLKIGESYHNFDEMETPLLLIATCSGIYVKPGNLNKYYECFDFVLALDQVNVNVTRREDGNTALHLAKDPVLVQKLLKRNACLNIKNREGQLPIQNSNITYEIFESHLNSCVTNIPEKLLDDQAFWAVIMGKDDDLANLLFLDICSFNNTSNGKDPPKLHLLDFISSVRDHEKLSKVIIHPCLATILEVYWKSAKFWILLKKSPMILMSILILFMFFSGDYSNWYSKLVVVFCCIIFILKLSIALPKRRSRTPFKKLLVLEFVCLALPIAWWILRWIMTYDFITRHILWWIFDVDTLLAMAFLCASLALTVYLSVAFQTVAQTLLMFIRVIQSTVFYSIRMVFILIGFSLCLKVMFAKYDEFKFQEKTSNNTLGLSSCFYSINKSIYMAMGELGTNELIFKSIMSFLLIALFILAISISFMNLLNGLAFDDVQTVKMEAEYLYRRFQIRFILIVQEETSNEVTCNCWYEKLIQEARNQLRKYVALTDELFPNCSLVGVNTVSRVVKSFERHFKKHNKIGQIDNELVTLLVQSMTKDVKLTAASLTEFSTTTTLEETMSAQVEWKVSIGIPPYQKKQEIPGNTQSDSQSSETPSSQVETQEIPGNTQSDSQSSEPTSSQVVEQLETTVEQKEQLKQVETQKKTLKKLDTNDLAKVRDFISENRVNSKDEAGKENMALIKIKRISLSNDIMIIIKCHDEYTYQWVHNLDFASINDGKYKILKEIEEKVPCSIRVLPRRKGYSVEEFKDQLVKGNPGVKIKSIVLHGSKLTDNGEAIIDFSVNKSGYESLKALNFEVYFDCMRTRICHETTTEAKKAKKRERLSRVDFPRL